MRLSPPLRMTEVGELLGGWSSDRVIRWLREKERESGVQLLFGRGERHPYTTTLAALGRACPDLFADTPGLEARVDEASEVAARIEAQQLQTAAAVGSLRREISRMQQRPEPLSGVLPRSGPRRGVQAA